MIFDDTNNRDKISFLKSIAEARVGYLKHQQKWSVKKLAQSKNLKTELNYWFMIPDVAEEIINLYWNSFKDLNGTNEIVQSNSDLPYSTGRIKYAHFAYAESLILNIVSTKEIIDQLRESYASIDLRFVDNAQSINFEWKQYIDNLNKGIITEIPDKESAMNALNDEIEFNNYIAEFRKLLT